MNNLAEKKKQFAGEINFDLFEKIERIILDN